MTMDIGTGRERRSMSTLSTKPGHFSSTPIIPAESGSNSSPVAARYSIRLGDAVPRWTAGDGDVSKKFFAARLSGLWTVCLHPNTMDETSMQRLRQDIREKFLCRIISIADVPLPHRRKSSLKGRIY